MSANETADRSVIEMVVVIVGLYHQVDRRKLVDRKARWGDAFRASPLYR